MVSANFHMTIFKNDGVAPQITDRAAGDSWTYLLYWEDIFLPEI